MILLPLLIGCVSGGVLVGALYRIGALHERSGLAVLLGAIASFWPVFAVQAGATVTVIAIHVFVFMAFSALAAYGFRHSATIIALGLVAHGVFDVIVLWAGHPGPDWWPAFCAALDIVAGSVVVFMIRTRRMTA